MKCTMHVALPKRPVIYFKLDQQSRLQALSTYCPNMYTLLTSHSVLLIVVEITLIKYLQSYRCATMKFCQARPRFKKRSVTGVGFASIWHNIEIRPWSCQFYLPKVAPLIMLHGGLLYFFVNIKNLSNFCQSRL